MYLAKNARIVEWIKAQIASGALGRGQKLPSLATLQAQFKTSPGTVRSAILALKAEGLIYGEQGVGMFVKTADPAVRRRRGAPHAPAQPARAANYQRIVADVKAQIASGALKPGDALPTYPQLQEHYGVSYGGVRDALITLKTEGVLVAHGTTGARVPLTDTRQVPGNG